MEESGRRQECLVEEKEKFRIGNVRRTRREMRGPYENAERDDRQGCEKQRTLVAPHEAANPVLAGEQEAEKVNELPSERVEKPGSLDGPSREIDALGQCEEIKTER